MTLNEILSMMSFGAGKQFDVNVTDQDVSTDERYFAVWSNNGPDYNGPFYCKGHKEEWKRNMALLKKYGSYNVTKIICIGSPSFYLEKP